MNSLSPSTFSRRKQKKKPFAMNRKYDLSGWCARVWLNTYGIYHSYPPSSFADSCVVYSTTSSRFSLYEDRSSLWFWLFSFQSNVNFLLFLGRSWIESMSSSSSEKNHQFVVRWKTTGLRHTKENVWWTWPCLPAVLTSFALVFRPSESEWDRPIHICRVLWERKRESKASHFFVTYSFF